jgi:hypothetical protein
MNKKRILHKTQTMITKVKFRVHVGFAALLNHLPLAMRAFNAALETRIKEVLTTCATMQIWMHFSTSRATFLSHIIITKRTLEHGILHSHYLSRDFQHV